MLLFISAILVGTFSTLALAAPKASQNYSKLILGQWLGPRKIEVYHADGTWGVRRHDEAPEDKDQRRWSIKGNKLTVTYPGEHGVETGTVAIVTLNSRRLIIEANGNKQEYERMAAKSK